MFCCKPKKREYDVANEEEIDKERSKDLKVETDNDVKDKADGIESPIEVTVTEVTESQPRTSHEQNGSVKKTEYQSGEGESGEKTHGEETVEERGERKNPKYVSQMSVSSSLSIREEINRSREQFFSNTSLNDFNLQEEISKRYSATEEKFAEHQRKVRQLRAQRKAEENVMSAEQMHLAVSRLEAVAARLESLATTGVKSGGGSVASSGPEEVAPFVKTFDVILSGEFARFMELSSKIGGDVEAQANMVKASFDTLRDFLITASKSKKPAQDVLAKLLGPLSQHISAIQEFREKNRQSPNFNHLSGISESIPALGWVSVDPTPGPYVKDFQDAGTFYTNRVLKEYREKDQTHVDWTKAWNGTLREMITYIKDCHTTGVSWNPQGGDASAAASSKPAAGGAAPPPPPPGPPAPPPPPPPTTEQTTSGGGGEETHAALFAEINKGTAISSGLKKVTDDMKTHKNPALRAGSTVTSSSGVRAGPAPFKAAAPPKPAPKPGSKPAAPAAKPPVFELQDKKWIVEYQVGNKTMVIENTNIKQAVYLFRCQDSTLQVKGKVNSIVVDSCKKVAVAFDDVVSSIEFVNSQSVQAQVMGKCPTVSIDKTDGCMMYLSKDSLNAEIVTAKSSEMNILVPKDDGDYGGDASAAASSKPAAGGAAPPPPPPGPPAPPPPPPPDTEQTTSGGGGEESHAALFAEINKGTAISSGLKKVTDDMKTHKNPALRAGSTVTSSSGVRAGPAPFKATAPPKPAPKPGSKPAVPAAKPPVFELQDKKWIVEYQVGNKTMVIENTNIKQAVYLFRCQDSTLQVKGKVNSIVVDSCKKVAVAFDDVVSSIEFVNSQSVQAQVMGKCPTVSIDKTDGCMMYLSKDSLNAEIVTAKSSEMNILVPKDDGDYAEFALPEQFKTTWNGKKFSTDCTDSV